MSDIGPRPYWLQSLAFLSRGSNSPPASLAARAHRVRALVWRVRYNYRFFRGLVVRLRKAAPRAIRPAGGRECRPDSVKYLSHILSSI